MISKEIALKSKFTDKFKKEDGRILPLNMLEPIIEEGPVRAAFRPKHRQANHSNEQEQGFADARKLAGFATYENQSSNTTWQGESNRNH